MDSEIGSGEGAFAAAIKEGRYPQDEHLDTLEQLTPALHSQHAVLNNAIDAAHSHEGRLQAALVGKAGDAQLAEATANKSMWGQHADRYVPAARGLTSAVGELRNLQGNLRLLIEAKEPAYNEAVNRGDNATADSILADAHAEADDLVLSHGGTAEGHIFAADFRAPIPKRPNHDGSGDKKEKRPVEDKWSSEKNDEVDPLSADKKTPGDKWSPETGDSDGSADGGPGTPAPMDGPGQNKWTSDPPGNPSSSIPSMPLSSSGFGSGGRGGGGGMGSGLGSGMGSPGGMGSGLGSSGGMGSGLGASTSPASAMSPPPAASASPMSSFNSGLASGMGGSGGAAPAQQPLAPFASQQPAAATPTGQVAPTSAASVPNWSAPADAAGAAGGHGGGAAGGPSGGGGVMPPAGGMAGGQPLAPYSPPGAGAAAGSGGGGGPTTPAGGAGSGQTAPAGGAAAAGAGPGAPPILAGNPGSSAAMAALAGSSTEMSADLLMAQRVVGELVRGSEDSGFLATWAVSVLRSPFGPQIMVAGSIGGGWYLPATVFLPTTAQLAVKDSALPPGWADDWMGCQFPSKILVDHFERVSQRVAGVTMSAMVTTELWAERPDCAVDFLAMEHKDALALLQDAPKLDAGHLHRLAVLDSGLAEYVHALDRGGEAAASVARALTDTVFGAAREPDSTAQSLVSDEDLAMWEAVKSNTADANAWAAYDAAADASDNAATVWPEQFAQTVLWYVHFYRRGRVIELLRCWKNHPPSLAELTYCAALGGFPQPAELALAAAAQHFVGPAGQKVETS